MSSPRKQDEAALRESELRYRTLFDLGPVAVYSCDVSGVIREFNHRAAELWGRSPALGDTDERFCGSFRMIRPDGSVLAHEECPMAEVLCGAVPHVRDAEVRIGRPDGSRVTVMVNIRPLKSEEGEITGAINCFYDITERKQAEEALHQSKEQLSDEAAALARLNELSSELWRASSMRDGLEKMLDAVMELLGADMGNVQLLDQGHRVLLIAAQSGFKQDFLDFFREVSTEDDSACGRALRTGERIVIEDVETDAPFAPFRPVARAAGYRAVQSTPLIGHGGTPLGMLSTHFRSVHRPTDQEMNRLDLYARQAADFIERKQAEQYLRDGEERFRTLADNMAQFAWTADAHGSIYWYNQRWFDYSGTTLEVMQSEGWKRVLHPDHLNRVVDRKPRATQPTGPNSLRRTPSEDARAQRRERNPVPSA